MNITLQVRRHITSLRSTSKVLTHSLVGLVLLVGCVGAPPEEDYVLSYTSIESAKQAQAPRYAPGLYTQAEDFYRKALADYRDRRYESAKNNFIRARHFAEKAENYTVLKKAESGEGP